MSKTLGEFRESYQDAYERLGGVADKDARLLRRLWENATEAEALRLQRDELLQALREVRDWSGSKPDWLHDMIDELLVKYDAVTGVTPTQEDSDE